MKEQTPMLKSESFVKYERYACEIWKTTSKTVGMVHVSVNKCLKFISKDILTKHTIKNEDLLI